MYKLSSSSSFAIRFLTMASGGRIQSRMYRGPASDSNSGAFVALVTSIYKNRVVESASFNSYSSTSAHASSAARASVGTCSCLKSGARPVPNLAVLARAPVPVPVKTTARDRLLPALQFPRSQQSARQYRA